MGVDLNPLTSLRYALTWFSTYGRIPGTSLSTIAWNSW